MQRWRRLPGDTAQCGARTCEGDRPDRLVLTIQIVAEHSCAIAGAPDALVAVAPVCSCAVWQTNAIVSTGAARMACGDSEAVPLDPRMTPIGGEPSRRPVTSSWLRLSDLGKLLVARETAPSSRDASARKGRS